MADLIIGYFQNIALHALDHSTDKKGTPLQHEAAVREELPQPMFEGNWETHASHCRMDADFKALVGQAQVRSLLVRLQICLCNLVYAHCEQQCLQQRGIPLFWPYSMGECTSMHPLRCSRRWSRRHSPVFGAICSVASVSTRDFGLAGASADAYLSI